MEKNHNILVDTLIRGMDCAHRLQNLTCGKMNNNVDYELVSVNYNDLLMEISKSFSVGLSILNAGGFGAETTSLNGSLATSGDRVSTAESETTVQPTIAKGGRGHYKRRKSMDSWDKISDTSEDAYQWRKYGQKQILNSKFPRCYYRCTNKDDKGCMATKYVQQLENETNNNNKFKITYFGHHTCCKSSTPHNHVISYHPGPGVVLDFEGFKTHGRQFSTINPSTTKSKRIKSSRKEKEDQLSTKIFSSNNVAPSSQALVSKDVLMTDDVLAMDYSFENGDFLNEILADDVFFMSQTLWDLR